jgi:hypothetical protein
MNARGLTLLGQYMLVPLSTSAGFEKEGVMMSSIKLATDTRASWVVFRLCSGSQAKHLPVEYRGVDQELSDAWGLITQYAGLDAADSERAVYALIGERTQWYGEYTAYAVLELSCFEDLEALMQRIGMKERLLKRRLGLSYVPSNFFNVYYVVDESGLLDY